MIILNILYTRGVTYFLLFFLIFKIVSTPGSGYLGTKKAKINDKIAIIAAIKKIPEGSTIHIYPKTAGKNTAGIWFIVNATATEDPISYGSAIF